MKPILAVIDIAVHANHDESAREQLLEKISQYKGNCIVPLWVNWLRMRADLRLVCLVHDLTLLDDFLVDVVRPIPGVRGTTSFLGFDGMVHPDIVEMIPLQESPWTRRAAATVMVSAEPGKDRDIYRALTKLPPSNQIEMAYVLKLFHCHACDMMVLILGERTASLTGYVSSWIRTIPGVEDTQVISTLDWKVLAGAEELVDLVRSFPVPVEQRTEQTAA